VRFVRLDVGHLVRRGARILAAILLVLVLVLGTLVAAFVLNFHVSAPKADYPEPASALEAQRQDLDYFAKAMALDRSFAPAARSAAEKRVADLKALAVAMPPPKLQVALMQAMALADNGHTRLDPIGGQNTLLLPVRVTRFAEGFFVMRTTSPHTDLLGGRLESIDGIAFDRIVSLLETLRGGTEGFRRENAADFIVVQNLLYGLGVASEADASVWSVRLPDGRMITQKLIAYPLRKGDELPGDARWLSPEPGKGAEAQWSAYRPASGDVPQTWRDFGDYFRLFSAGTCAQVVRLQRIGDADGQRIEPFLAQTEAAFRAHPPCAVIVDLRGDGGGDYTHAWHFTHALPGLLAAGGRIYVLTDPGTFSAAITAAAFVKDAGGDRVTIIGEPVGDRLSFYSEGGSACLPNLKTCVNYQTGKHDYAAPCKDWHACYWLNWLYPVRVNSLQPDVLVPVRFADWNAGHDAAFEQALSLSGNKP